MLMNTNDEHKWTHACCHMANTDQTRCHLSLPVGQQVLDALKMHCAQHGVVSQLVLGLQEKRVLLQVKKVLLHVLQACQWVLYVTIRAPGALLWAVAFVFVLIHGSLRNHPNTGFRECQTMNK